VAAYPSLVLNVGFERCQISGFGRRGRRERPSEVRSCEWLEVGEDQDTIDIEAERHN
jgi:hypothetical protein